MKKAMNIGDHSKQDIDVGAVKKVEEEVWKRKYEELKDEQDRSNSEEVKKWKRKYEESEETNAKHAKAYDERQQRVQQVMEEREELQEERDQLQLVMDEMRSKVECPVCLVVPREGPVPQCLSGHFICSGCKEKRVRQGKQDCPSCRGPMGEARSLLASVVIENIEHECDNKDCDEMIPYKELKSHLSACKHRLVLCPGDGRTCSKLVPFMEVLHHITTCADNIQEPWVGDRENFTLTDELLGSELEVTWKTKHRMFNDKTFFFRMKKVEKIFYLEVVLLGTQKEADKYYAEISIFNFKNPVKSVKTCFEPRPIGRNKWDSDCFIVKEGLLAKLWSYNVVEKQHKFIVKVQITKIED